jgi:Phosphotransferase enzyme family
MKISHRDVVASVRAGSEDVAVRPLTGGLNNTVFAVTLPDGTPACCKLFRSSDRHADEREWNALCLLRDANAELAPIPLYHEPGAVLMSFVHGEGLGGTSLDLTQVQILANRLDRLYSFPVPASMPVVIDAVDGVERIRGLHGTVASDDPALGVAGKWLATTEPDELKTLDMSVFGRGDPNLANCLWHPPVLSFVDWEYSGRTSRAFELGDLIEHIQSRATSDATWEAFVETFDLTRSEKHSLALTRRLMSVYWLLLLQPGQPAAAINPPESRTVQSERVLALLGAPS